MPAVVPRAAVTFVGAPGVVPGVMAALSAEALAHAPEGCEIVSAPDYLRFCPPTLRARSSSRPDRVSSTT